MHEFYRFGSWTLFIKVLTFWCGSHVASWQRAESCLLAAAGPEPSETACGVRYRTVIESSIVAVSEYYSDSSGPILRGFEGSGVMQENASAGEKGRAWISLLVARSSLCLGVMPSLFLLAMLWGDHLLLVGFEATACRLHWTYSWGSDIHPIFRGHSTNVP